METPKQQAQHSDSYSGVTGCSHRPALDRPAARKMHPTFVLIALLGSLSMTSASPTTLEKRVPPSHPLWSCDKNFDGDFSCARSRCERSVRLRESVRVGLLEFFGGFTRIDAVEIWVD
ncbi:uncharacterized protein K460DRAFT_394374 [Cucurbitaria berberidis CBS 394.84]|uniref:Uncharacterized protein n=1 Tax=Cucurbitaria berberidis CBS 394.84 TaxID=1168544 RepID=A0A9P4GFG2_9PLEO|nr:uncharacterized protein K460DRAFT_394374 [Cucurbitaria berberidis CBS 394.84]KAF1844501.1 hypothetical protein K460DRAFT_394374 [Cucurbitaria berberidis CBS 394.84]